MKPRLNPAPLTTEDGDIWARVVNRSRRCFSSHDAGLYHRVTLGADRRDADLMLYAQQHKLVTWVGPPMIHVRNAVSAYWSDPPWQGVLE